MVVAGVFLIVGFLAANAVENLELLGKSFGFNFLWEPASYDINQPFIEYNARDTHFRAAVVGLINTAVVAVAGFIFASILGFLFGVLRLSSNWLISRLVYCYIEFTRNVPVLVQILLWHGVIVTTLQPPRDALSPVEGVYLTNRGFYIPEPVFASGFWLVVAAFLATIVGMVIFSRWARSGRRRPARSIRSSRSGSRRSWSFPRSLFLRPACRCRSTFPSSGPSTSAATWC